MLVFVKQMTLLILIAAAAGLGVNALRPGGLTLHGALDATIAPMEKHAAVMADPEIAAAEGPSVHVPDYRFEFGTVPEGVDVAHAFVVGNRGTRVLRIDQVKPG